MQTPKSNINIFFNACIVANDGNVIPFDAISFWDVRQIQEVQEGYEGYILEIQPVFDWK